MRDLGNDPFGLGGPGELSADALGAAEPFVAQVRDQALMIVRSFFGKETSFGSPNVRTTTGLDVEMTLVGDYFLFEAILQTPRGEEFPSLTFVHREELAAGLDLDLPSDPSDWSVQVDRLQNPLELMVEAVNSALGSPGQHALLGSASVRAVALPEESASLRLAPDEQLVELTYQMEIADVGELTIVTLAPIDLVHRLGGAEASVGVGAGPALGRVADDLLSGFGPDPFADPSGRAGADVLGGALSSHPRSGGMEMMSNAPSGGYGGGSAGRDVGVVRPAQFQQFGEPGGGESVSNIDLIMDVSLRITVELGRTSMSIREILELGPGAVIELDKLAGEPVDIIVNDKPIAKGEVVVVDENFGVRVTEIISPAKRVASLR